MQFSNQANAFETVHDLEYWLTGVLKKAKLVSAHWATPSTA
jgi:hypothetical protein